MKRKVGKFNIDLFKSAVRNKEESSNKYIVIDIVDSEGYKRKVKINNTPSSFFFQSEPGTNNSEFFDWIGIDGESTAKYEFIETIVGYTPCLGSFPEVKNLEDLYKILNTCCEKPYSNNVEQKFNNNIINPIYDEDEDSFKLNFTI